jgi:hypothetical protein
MISRERMATMQGKKTEGNSLDKNKITAFWNNEPCSHVE